ncbi:MAG: signal peptidase II [Planctomycetota bacterium]
MMDAFAPQTPPTAENLAARLKGRSAAGAAVDEQPASAIGHVASQVRFWLPAAALLWLDLWSKSWVFANLPTDHGQIIIPGFLEFRRSLNDGAVFGSFTGYVGVFIVASLFALGFVFYLFANSTRRQRSLHISLALILAGAIGNLYDRAFIKADIVRFRDGANPRGSVIGTLAGEPTEEKIRLGDWPDGANARSFTGSEVTLHRQGVVRDFIKFIPKFPRSWYRVGGFDMWPWIFNVADAALVCGVGLLLLNCFFDRKPRVSTVIRPDQDGRVHALERWGE